MNDFYASQLEHPFKPQIEVRHIDTDKEIRWITQKVTYQTFSY